MASAKKSNSPLVFTKSIKKSYVKRPLPIPASVYSQHKNGTLRGTLNLCLGSTSWQVEVTDGSLHAGWESFCTDNQVKENDIIYFRHNAGRDFSVEIFNNDGSAKAITPLISGKKRGRAKSSLGEADTEAEGEAEAQAANMVVSSDNAAEIIDKLTAQLDENHDLTFTVTKVPKPTTGDAPTPKKVSARNKSPAKENNATTSTPVTTSPSKSRRTVKKPAAAEDVTPQPAQKKARTTTPAPKPTATPKAAAKPNVTPASTSRGGRANKKQAETTPRRSSKKVTTPPASANVEKSADVVTDTGTGTGQEEETNKTPAAQDKKRKAPQGKATPQKSPKKTARSPRKSTVKRSPKKTSPGKARAKAAIDESSGSVKQARAFKSNNPHVLIVMKKSNLHPCFYLNIPSEFSKAHMPPGALEYDMLDATNKAWGVRWLGSKSAFSGGWCYFAQDHNLALGDAVVMELIGKENVKIHIFRSDSAAPTTTVAKPVTTTTVSKMTVVEEDGVITATAELEDNIDENVPGEEGLTIDVEKVVAAITVETSPIPIENGIAKTEAVDEVQGNVPTPAEDELEGEGESDGNDGEEDDDEDYDPNEDDAGGDDGN